MPDTGPPWRPPRENLALWLFSRGPPIDCRPPTGEPHGRWWVLERWLRGAGGLDSGVGGSLLRHGSEAARATPGDLLMDEEVMWWPSMV